MHARTLVFAAPWLLVLGATACGPEMDTGPNAWVVPEDTAPVPEPELPDFSGTWHAATRTYFDEVIAFPEETGAVSGSWTLEVQPDRATGDIEVTPGSETHDFEPYTLGASFEYLSHNETLLRIDASALSYQSPLSYTCTLLEPQFTCEGGPANLGNLTFQR